MTVINFNPVLTAPTRRRFIKYRYPTELWLLVATLFVIGAAIFSARYFSLGGFAFFLFTGLIFNYLFIRAVVEGFKREAVQVTATQFPELHALVEECRQHIEIPRDTKVFVSYSPYMNAFAIGLGRPYAIVLFSGLVDNLDRDELKYVLAHEMGHIHFGHTIWLTLIGQLGSQTYGVPILRTVFRLIFLFWSRAAEMSADRAGLVACGQLDKVISTQVKMGAGPLLARWANLDMLARQAREARISFFGSFVELLGTHPTMTTRIRRLVDFAASETFRRLRPDIYARQDASGWSVDGAAANGADTATAKPRPVIRRLLPKSNSSAPIAQRNGAAPNPMFDSDPPEPEKPDDDAPATEPDVSEWPQELGYQRMTIAAMRANAEQSDMWLKLGELFQVHGQPQQAAACLQRAHTLLSGTKDNVPEHAAASAGDLALMAFNQQWELPPKTPTGSVTCPKCDTPNPNRARFCYQCQASLRRACLQCGALLMPNHPNCTYCGQNQAQAISALKDEAESVRQAATQPVPPRMLRWYEIVFGVIFLIDVMIVLWVLTPQWSTRNSEQMALFIGGAVLIWLISLIGGTIWARRRVRRHWRVFDEVDFSVRRYNEIADILAQQNISLKPERLTPRNPWRWT